MDAHRLAGKSVMPHPFEQPHLPTSRALEVLQEAEFKVTHGLLPWGSNYTFLASLALDDLEVLVIYKPRQGERPLWDFPEGTLCQRERAAFLISEALGWKLVPPTVLRDGPYGFGMVQLFVPHDPQQNYFSFGPKQRPQLKRIALFDHIINNADRKGGHCLLAPDGHIWCIDHGVSFHEQPKLRTVIWDFAGQKIPAHLLKDLHELQQALEGPPLVSALRELLSLREIGALRRRIRGLLKTGIYPKEGPGRNFPWPPI
jgi:uncharacterized repeat protein (TIGR03843 family)